MDRNSLCRQSSTRWIPTADQIRILRDLYYVNGVRSPNAEQIQRIAARLRQYGRVEGKNVFYWFQNHKARERQKKKLTLGVNDLLPPNNPTTNYAGLVATAPPSSPGFYDVVGKPPATCGYGGGSMFRECSVVETSNYMPWIYPYIKEDEDSQEIQTLPLFPTNSSKEEEQEEDHDYGTISTLHHSFTNSSSGYNSSSQNQHQQDYHYYYNSSNNNNNNIGAASLELTLNSYGSGSM